MRRAGGPSLGGGLGRAVPRRRRAGQPSGRWVDEAGCIHQIEGNRLDKTCGPHRRTTITILDPGRLQLSYSEDGSSGGEPLSYARVGPDMFLGSGASGRRFNDTIVVHDGWRIVMDAKGCRAYARVIVIGGGRDYWDDEAQTIRCRRDRRDDTDVFVYQREVYQLDPSGAGSGFILADTEIEVTGDVLIDSYLKQHRLRPVAAAN